MTRHRTDTGAAGPDLAYQQLFVTEQILGQTKSRLVDGGGVHLNMVETYAMTVDNLEPMAKQRRGIGNVQLEMLRFTFMIDELPPGRRFTAVRVRISLTPPARPHGGRVDVGDRDARAFPRGQDRDRPADADGGIRMS